MNNASGEASAANLSILAVRSQSRSVTFRSLPTPANAGSRSPSRSLDPPGSAPRTNQRSELASSSSWSRLALQPHAPKAIHGAQASAPQRKPTANEPSAARSDAMSATSEAIDSNAPDLNVVAAGELPGGPAHPDAEPDSAWPRANSRSAISPATRADLSISVILVHIAMPSARHDQAAQAPQAPGDRVSTPARANPSDNVPSTAAFDLTSCIFGLFF